MELNLPAFNAQFITYATRSDHVIDRKFGDELGQSIDANHRREPWLVANWPLIGKKKYFYLASKLIDIDFRGTYIIRTELCSGVVNRVPYVRSLHRCRERFANSVFGISSELALVQVRLVLESPDVFTVKREELQLHSTSAR